jgi:hypothetical protein
MLKYQILIIILRQDNKIKYYFHKSKNKQKKLQQVLILEQDRKDIIVFEIITKLVSIL